MKFSVLIFAYLNASTQSLRVESEMGVVIGRNRKYEVGS